jgi:uncharacterized membrane protein (UPF0127 family)
MKIKHVKTGKFLGEKVKEAKSIFDRTLGLMFSSEMKGFDGLLLSPCPSIHTFFMRYSIDVIFLDKSFQIIKIIRGMKPWRMSALYSKAYYGLELNSGTIDESISEGDQLEVVHV